jgi:anaerobic magnesium-protoporphyrin IX monomethyl ester cyclase
VILINPRSTKFGIFDRYVPLSVPISIGSLAGYFVSHKKEIEIVDEHVRVLTQELLEEITQKVSKPYVFGISVLTACVKRSYEIARMIKNRYPDSIIIMGGIHPTVRTDEVLENDDIDLVVRSEAEEVLLELYEALKNKGDYSRIRGLSFKKDGHVVHNPGADLPDLSLLPSFPYNLFDKYSDRYNFGFIASSRGCPYDCIFCSQRSISGQKFRYVPNEIVIDEIDLLIHKYQQTHINFLDDNFTANKKRIVSLCEEMIKRRFYEKSTFDCQTRADAVNDEILILLKKAGFRLINFGLETASERLMVILNKKETVRENIEAVRLVKKHGFGVSATFIFGLPTETQEERWQAYRLAKELDLDYVRFNNATPYPGTHLYEIAKAEGRLFVKKDWSNLNACASLVQDSLTDSRLPYVPAGTDEKTLRKDIVRANLFFSLRPKKVFRLLAKRVGPAGWFYLPPRWYLVPQEWFSLFRLAGNLLKSFIRSFF